MIQLINQNNMMKECPTGYSWTTFFFGVFVPLMRGDIKWAAILFALCALIAIITAGIGAFFITPIFAFFYNKLYIKELLEKGYTGADDYSRNYLISNGLIFQQSAAPTQAPTAPATPATSVEPPQQPKV